MGRQSLAGRRSRVCKGPELGVAVAHGRNRKEANVAEEWKADERQM